jgi:type IV secretory pathway VirB6-like protein
VSVAFAFAVFMIAAIINVAAIVVGPVFLALAAIPTTRRFAAGWLGVLVGGCVTQLMALAVIQLLSGAENNMIQQTVVTAAASNSNSLGMLWGLAQCGILLALCTAVVKKIPDIAQAIASGVYHGAAGLNVATFGAAGSVAGGTVGVARGVAGAIGANAAKQMAPQGFVRAAKPTGPSLSAGKST